MEIVAIARFIGEVDQQRQRLGGRSGSGARNAAASATG